MNRLVAENAFGLSAAAVVAAGCVFTSPPADQHAAPRGAQPPPIPKFDPNPPRLATVVTVHDGDSAWLRFATLNAPGVKQTTDIAVRFWGYDAQELTTNVNGPADPVDGPKARDALIKLLGSGKVWVRFTGESSFDRSVAEVWVVPADGVPIAVADRMKELGFDRTPKAK